MAYLNATVDTYLHLLYISPSLVPQVILPPLHQKSQLAWAGQYELMNLAKKNMCMQTTQIQPHNNQSEQQEDEEGES